MNYHFVGYVHFQFCSSNFKFILSLGMETTFRRTRRKLEVLKSMKDNIIEELEIAVRILQKKTMMAAKIWLEHVQKVEKDVEDIEKKKLRKVNGIGNFYGNMMSTINNTTEKTRRISNGADT